jgi:ketosteroid isomerase-like protein
VHTWFVIDRLRAAAEALNEGDVEPFVALIAEDGEWRGVTTGHLWWKKTAACHGPDEAREALRVQSAKRRALGARPQEFTQIGDRIIGGARWTTPDGRDQERFQVLTVRDGKIVDIQGCRSRREAQRFAGSPAV